MHGARVRNAAARAQDAHAQDTEPADEQHNYWQKKFSEAFDPDQGSDKGFYTDETEFDFSEIAPERVAKPERLVKERAWTELGPPE
ncbi:MAG TPA: hypothetical protein VIK22_14480 [Candidatus Anoxymicrobiaceae bacterium]|jgi:hypothetical protein